MTVPPGGRDDLENSLSLSGLAGALPSRPSADAAAMTDRDDSFNDLCADPNDTLIHLPPAALYHLGRLAAPLPTNPSQTLGSPPQPLHGGERSPTLSSKAA